MKTETLKKVTFTKWDPVKYINTKEAVIAHIEAVLEENDTELFLSVINDIARSKGMSKIARELGISREGLYRSLAPTGNPSFQTVFKLLDILGLRIKVEPKSA